MGNVWEDGEYVLIDKPLRAWGIDVDEDLLEQLAKVPARITLKTARRRIEWALEDGRYLDAADYGKHWCIISEGKREGNARGGHIGSCMSRSRVIAIAKAVVRQQKNAFPFKRDKCRARGDSDRCPCCRTYTESPCKVCKMEFTSRTSECPPVDEAFAYTARVVISNALLAARNKGEAICRHHCRRCLSPGTMAPDGVCMPCAVVEFCNLDSNAMVEDEIAAAFLVPYQWVLDLISGFDGESIWLATYRDAHQVGRDLWRKHGTKTKRSRNNR